MQHWRGPLLQHLRHKRQQLTSADALAQQHLLKRCLSAWMAAVAAQHSKQASIKSAHTLRHQSLLRQGMLAFLLLHAELQQERRELAAVAEPALQVLQQRKRRQVLRAWLAAVRQEQRQQARVSICSTPLCCLLSVVAGVICTPVIILCRPVNVLDLAKPACPAYLRCDCCCQCACLCLSCSGKWRMRMHGFCGCAMEFVCGGSMLPSDTARQHNLSWLQATMRGCYCQAGWRPLSSVCSMQPTSAGVCLPPPSTGAHG